MIAIYILREVLRLLLMPSQLTFARIERMTGCNHQTVGELHKRLIASSITLKDLDSLDDSELRQAIYPKILHKRHAKVLPPFTDIRQEVLKKHKQKKTLIVMFLEYKQRYGALAYGKSRFFQLIRENLKQHQVVMKQLYLPGEALFIDYAGVQLKFIDNGKEIRTPVFVACLGYSKKIFAIATKDMTSLSWTYGLAQALKTLGGVPEIIQFDNAKAMVTTPGKLAQLNDNAREFTKHYECAADTSRVASPKDNANAEAAVKFITQRIIIPMKQDLTFLSLAEVNQYLFTEVEKLNELPMQRKGVSRNDLFYADEQAQLSALPLTPYEPTIYHTSIKTPSNYHIRYLNNEYSVPFELANKYIEIRVKGEKLYIIAQSQVRAIHQLIDGFNNVVSLDAHLQPKHRAESRKSKDQFVLWARRVGVDAERIVIKQYEQYEQCKNSKSRSAGKCCGELQKLCNDYGAEAFCDACEYGLMHDMATPTDIKLILKAKAYETLAPTALIAHENVRGKDYFGGTIHD